MTIDCPGCEADVMLYPDGEPWAGLGTLECPEWGLEFEYENDGT